MSFLLVLTLLHFSCLLMLKLKGRNAREERKRGDSIPSAGKEKPGNERQARKETGKNRISLFPNFLFSRRKRGRPLILSHTLRSFLPDLLLQELKGESSKLLSLSFTFFEKVEETVFEKRGKNEKSHECPSRMKCVVTDDSRPSNDSVDSFVLEA